MDMTKIHEVFKSRILEKWDGRRSVIDKAFKSRENASREYLRKLCEFLCSTKSLIYLNALAIYKYKWYLDVPLKEYIDEVNRGKDAEDKMPPYDEWLCYVGPYVEAYPLLAYVDLQPESQIYYSRAWHSIYSLRKIIYFFSSFYVCPLFVQFWSCTSLDSFHDQKGVKHLRIDNSDMRQELKRELKEEVKKELKEELKEKLEEGLQEDVKKGLNEELKEELKGELKKELKEEVKGELKEELRGELKEEVKEELKEELTEELKEELKEDMKRDLKEELKGELKEELQDELKGELKEAMKEELKAELKEALKEELTEDVKRDLNEELKREIENAKNQLQDAMSTYLEKDLPLKLMNRIRGELKQQIAEELQHGTEEEIAGAKETATDREKYVKMPTIERLRIELREEFTQNIADDLRGELKEFVKRHLEANPRPNLNMDLAQVIDDLKRELTAQLEVATGSTNRSSSDGDQLPIKPSTELEGNVRNALSEMQQLAEELPLIVERKIKTKVMRQLREELNDEIADEVANGLRELKRKQRQMIDDLKDLLAGELKDEILRSIEDDFKQFVNDFRQRTTE